MTLVSRWGMRIVMIAALSVCARSQQLPTPASSSVPQLVNFSGRAADGTGKPITGTVGITFSIYQAQYGGSPLWMETQNVQTDAKGNYTVQLGANSSHGLPLDLFVAGEARWLAVRINGGEEQPRVLLLSVPYALKAADAQTLGGLPASAFVLAAPATGGDSGASNRAGSSAASPLAPYSNVGGSGTQNYIPLWTDNTGDLGNSILYQLGSGSSAKIGINLKSPLATLDVNGETLIRGTLEPITKGYATASKGYNSNPLNFESSAFSSSTQKYTLNHFQWQAEPSGNNTSSPGATLNLLYGTDPNQPAETGLKLSSTGIFTFAAGQTFPGSGTITGVTAGTDLTGGGTSGNVTLNLDTTKVPQLNSANTFTQSQTVNSSNCCVPALIATGSDEGVEGDSANSGVVGVHTGNGLGFGLFGKTSSQSGYGVEGNNAGGGVGVYGVTTAPATAAVMGVNADKTTGGYGVFGSTPTGIGVYGVSTLNGTGVNGTSGNIGVYGLSSGASGFTGTSAGVWGDTFNSSNFFSAGVLGTANETGSGTNFGVEGVWGNSSGGTGVLNVTAAGVFGDSSQHLGVFASSDSFSALWALNQSSSNATIIARNDASTTDALVFGAIGNLTNGGSCTINQAGDLACTGTKSAVVPVSDNREVLLYAVESPENWFEDFGTEHLVSGKATVTLDPTFAETVNLKADYHVFLTPNGDCKGLYVERKGPSSFEVRELGGGRSSVAFDYRIVAKRLGHENKRLVDIHSKLEQFRTHSNPRKLRSQVSFNESSGR